MIFLPDQFDNVAMSFLAGANETRTAAVEYDFLEVWDTEKARLLKL